MNIFFLIVVIFIYLFQQEFINTFLLSVKLFHNQCKYKYNVIK